MQAIFDHPDTDLLELHLLNRLITQEAEAVEEHVLICGDCQFAMHALEQDIRAIRAALN